MPHIISPQQALQRLIDHRELFYDEMLHIMRLIFRGEVSQVMVAAILTALRTKKETVGEITAIVRAMLEYTIRVPISDANDLVDIVGTGGDGLHTFNISTCAVFVVAAAGAKTAKQCGRGIGNKSGSWDVLEALGVNIDLSPEQIAAGLHDTGIGFMYGAKHQPGHRNITAVRKELGFRTVFNMIGPMLNPAGAVNILMGVYSPDLVSVAVQVLQQLGAQHALVIYGRDGLDEISIGDSTMVGELKDGVIHEYEIHPRDFGMTVSSYHTLQINNKEESAAMLRSVLNNEPGPARDIVVLNSGAALYAANKVSSIHEGVNLADEVLTSGAALAKLEQFVAFSQQAN